MVANLFASGWFWVLVILALFFAFPVPMILLCVAAGAVGVFLAAVAGTGKSNAATVDSDDVDEELLAEMNHRRNLRRIRERREARSRVGR